MGYHTTNAAYAYDMQAAPSRAPREASRPRFDVYTGEGREANQQASPAFVHVIKLFCMLVALFCAIGLARVTIASFTTAELNAGAEASTSLTAARDASSELEVMRSVYGADSRIYDLATGTLGMVEAHETVTLDLGASAAGDAATGAAAE